MLHLAILSVLYELDVEFAKDVMTATFNDTYLTEIASPPQTCIDIKPQNVRSTGWCSNFKYIEKQSTGCY